MILIWQGSQVISDCVKSHMKLESPLCNIYISFVAKMRLMLCVCGCSNVCVLVICVLVVTAFCIESYTPTNTLLHTIKY